MWLGKKRNISQKLKDSNWKWACEKELEKITANDLLGEFLINYPTLIDKYLIGIRYIKEGMQARIHVARWYRGEEECSLSQTIAHIEFNDCRTTPEEASCYVGSIIVKILNGASSMYEFYLTTTNKVYTHIWDTYILAKRKPFMPPY